MRTPFFPPALALLPRAPQTASPVPGLTSLYHKAYRGPYGDPAYPGNCSGELIRDLLLYFRPARVLDPMTGSGTCADVCRDLAIDCVSGDLRDGFDAADPASYAGLAPFDFVWLHPPYWRQKRYTADARDLSAAPDLPVFLGHLDRLLGACAGTLAPGGKLAVLMGDYTDRSAGFVPLVYYTKRLAFAAGLRQHCTDIVRFSHGASSARKAYRSAFIPGLHDTCVVFESTPAAVSVPPTDRGGAA